MRNLVVATHPDDEAIYMGGTLLTLPEVEWHVICATSGTDPHSGPERARQLRESCSRLGVHHVDQWGFPDTAAGRLDVEHLTHILAQLGEFDAIYTHGPLGEYGHPHHQDVSYAVHQAFAGHPALYSVALHVPADEVVVLSAEIFNRKFTLLREVYGEGLRTALPLFPLPAVEPFARIPAAESRTLYRFLAYGEPIRHEDVRYYREILPFIEDGSCRATAARFMGAYPPIGPARR